MDYINIYGIDYKCEIYRSCIKRIYIRYQNDTLIIRVPNRIKDKEIIKIIDDNKDKIYKIIDKVNNKIRYTFKNSTEIPFFGKTYKIIYSNEECIRSDYMYLNSMSPIDSYYKLVRKYGKEFYKNRINYFIEKYNLNYKVNQIVIRDMKTRYGVCNIKDKKITFQLKLALYPMECIDYVIIHELTHFKIQNHSKEFYNEIVKIMPDYKLRIKKLKEIY